jgi:hypothetical protein
MFMGKSSPQMPFNEQIGRVERRSYPGCITSVQPELPPASRTPFVGSAADHSLNLRHEFFEIERFGHDFHALLHKAAADGCALSIAG